jgi:hypothetical protein
VRVNNKVFDERQDLFSDLYVKGCPSQFEKEANRILNMVAKPGYSIGDYHTMSQLDKKLMVDYWQEYDGLTTGLLDFPHWFETYASTPELIRRARQWLVEHNYLIIKSDVRDRADEAGDKFRVSMRK